MTTPTPTSTPAAAPTPWQDALAIFLKLVAELEAFLTKYALEEKANCKPPKPWGNLQNFDNPAPDKTKGS
jgi:hypothetical protein